MCIYLLTTIFFVQNVGYAQEYAGIMLGLPMGERAAMVEWLSMLSELAKEPSLVFSWPNSTYALLGPSFLAICFNILPDAKER
jgi:hypothetical protein